MSEALGPLVVLALAAVGFALTQTDLRPIERSYLWAALAFHFVAAAAQVWVTRDYYRGGDMLLYHSTGTSIARWIAIDPDHAWLETLRLLAREHARMPFHVIGVGDTTGSMSAVAGVLQAFFGPSLHATCFALAALSFAGKLAIYRCFREVYPGVLHTRILLAALATPSLVYWTAGLLKEALAVAGLGFLVLGMHRAIQRHLVRALPLLAIGLPLVAVSKPYVLFPLVLASGVWFYWDRMIARSGGRTIEIRPVALVVAAVLALGGLVILGEVFPRYGIDGFAEHAAHLQHVGARIDGGSNYEVADGSTATMAGQLAYAPIALLTALFRPLIFEVRNLPMAISAIETTLLAVLVARAFTQRGWHTLWAEMRRSPVVMMSAVFVLTFGVAVGLSSTNLGTLSRYRVPMLPFLVGIVLFWLVPTPAVAPRAAQPEREGEAWRSGRNTEPVPPLA